MATDTGGSVRLPAAYNGIIGYKPSYGLISRHGVIPYANSLDTVGLLAHGVQTIRRAFGEYRRHCYRTWANCHQDVLNQYDEKDPTSIKLSTRRKLQRDPKASSHSPWKIGVPEECNTFELDPFVRQAWISILATLQGKGHTIVPVSMPQTRSALSAYYVLAPSEASSNLAKYDGVRYGKPANTENTASRHVLYSNTRGMGFGAEVKRRILLGSHSLSATAFQNYFIQAQKVRRLVQQEFDGVFRRANPLVNAQGNLPSGQNHVDVDVLITPTAPTLPPKISALTNHTSTDSFSDDVLTVPASLAGLPAVSVPVAVEAVEGVAERPSVPFAGMQVIGQFGDDDLVLKVAEELERL